LRHCPSGNGPGFWFDSGGSVLVGAGGLLGRVGGQEVRRTVLGGVVVAGARRLGRPQREAVAPGVGAGGVELGDQDVGVAAGQRALGERVHLGAVVLRAEERVFVRRQVEALGVDPDVRVVADARAVGVDRRAVAAVVGHVHPVEVPGLPRVGGHRDVEVVVAGQRPGRGGLQGEHDQEEPVGRRVVQAGRVGELGPVDAGGPVDRGRVAEEGVEVDDAGLPAAVGVEDAERVVHRLHDVPVAHAEGLVRRFDAELVAVVGGPLVDVVEAVEAPQELRSWPDHAAGPGSRTGVGWAGVGWAGERTVGAAGSRPGGGEVLVRPGGPRYLGRQWPESPGAGRGVAVHPGAAPLEMPGHRPGGRRRLRAGRDPDHGRYGG
jgi:hypothetical protein